MWRHIINGLTCVIFFFFILLYNDQLEGVGRGFFVVFSFVFELCFGWWGFVLRLENLFASGDLSW